MDLRRELILSIGAIVVLNMILAFGVIGLFVRMGPAIELILEENVYSIVAAEEVLAVFAAAGDAPVSGAGEARVRDAVGRSRNNVTEDAETPVLDAIERSLTQALAEPGESRRRVIERTGALIAINRDAMRRVDDEAQRLGTAGAWAAVLVGFLSLVLSLIVLARLRERFVLPVLELYDVLTDATGDGKRRCRPRQAPIELRRVADAVNTMLDEKLQAVAALHAPTPGTRGIPSGDRPSVGAALVALLEERDEATVVLDPAGEIVRANARALAALASSEGRALRDALRIAQPAADGAEEQAAELREPRTPWRAERLPGRTGWICSLGGATTGSVTTA